MSQENAYPPFSLLGAWPQTQQATFIGALKQVTFDDSQIVFERGEDSREVYFILGGAVKSVNFNPDGAISYFRIRQSGDCFGYYSAIGEAPRTATMIAVGETKLARMNGPDFVTLVAEHPEIGCPFLKLVVGLLRTETDRLTHLTTLTVPQRVAAELAARKSAQPVILGDRTEFASYLGMTRESLSRALSALEKQKLIRVGDKEIVILDALGLTNLANDAL